MKRCDGGVIAGERLSPVCRPSRREASKKLLNQSIEVLLTDEHRSGAPATFTFEQFMQIMALACEKPEAAERPVSSWTPRELQSHVQRGFSLDLQRASCSLLDSRAISAWLYQAI
jgi:hypothetical protein